MSGHDNDFNNESYGQAEVDPSASDTIQKAIIAKESSSSTRAQIIGTLFAIIGAILIYLGFEGSIDLGIQSEGVKANVANASPGIIFLVIGLIVIIAGKFNFKHRKA